MKYITILMFIVIWMLPAGPALSDDERYRVEILVLYHLRNEHDPREVGTLNDYSDALDFLQPPEEQTDPQSADNEVYGPGSEPADLLNAVVHLAEAGPEMQEAWRRLRSSAPFRPLQYLGWEQGSNSPFPVLRVHDLEVVLVQDPWAEQRTAEQSAYGLNLEDALAEPITYYRLDGTASLTRARFLHLALAIEWREPLYDADGTVLAGSPLPAGEATAEMGPVEPQPTAFRVHRLEQRRSVRTGRIEYFDSPALGVLAYVTRLDDALTESVTE